MKLTTNKETAIRNFINDIWLKDNDYYCNGCGDKALLNPETLQYEQCCPTPQLATPKQLLIAFAQDNKRIRESRLNEFGSNKTKDFRIGISMPPVLYHAISDYCVSELNEPFLKDKNEMDDFMRAFPEFRSCKTV